MRLQSPNNWRPTLVLNLLTEGWLFLLRDRRVSDATGSASEIASLGRRRTAQGTVSVWRDNSRRNGGPTSPFGPYLGKWRIRIVQDHFRFWFDCAAPRVLGQESSRTQKLTA